MDSLTWVSMKLDSPNNSQELLFVTRFQQHPRRSMPFNHPFLAPFIIIIIIIITINTISVFPSSFLFL
jgi:hypothetical protein